MPAVVGAFKGRVDRDVKTVDLLSDSWSLLLPVLFFGFVMVEAYVAVTAPPEAATGPAADGLVDRHGQSRMKREAWRSRRGCRSRRRPAT